MNKTSIRDSIKLRPFRAFVINISDGQRFRVNDPDFIFMPPNQDIVIIFIDEHYYIIDSDKITTLELI